MNLVELVADYSVIDLPTSCSVDIKAITQDSRRVQPGCLFFAMPGYTNDGRDFIQEAIGARAAAILYEPCDKILPISESDARRIPIIPVENLAKKTGEIAARFYGYPSRSMQVIGVTGTNGKTSVTQFIAQMLAPEKSCGLLGTLGVGFLSKLQTTPLTTLDPISLQKCLKELRDQGANIVAMEVSSHALAQHRVAGIEFDVAILTQLSRDHLDFHGSMKNYAAAKSSLFAMPTLTHRILNADDALGQSLIQQYANTAGLVTYSINPNDQNPASTFTFVHAKQLYRVQQGYEVAVESSWGSGKFVSNIYGKFNVSNLLAVFCVMEIFGIPFDVALQRLSMIQAVPGRLQSSGGEGKLPLVIVDYSHTPDALQKVLQALRPHCQGALWCVFGCGGNRDRGKRAKMGAVAEQFSDHIIITNDNPRSESPKQIVDDILLGMQETDQAKVVINREKAIKYAVQKADINDIVLIAGKGHESYQVLGERTIPFSDQREVEKQLALRSKSKS